MAVHRGGVGVRGREVLRHPGEHGRLPARSLLQGLLEVPLPRRQHCEFSLYYLLLLFIHFFYMYLFIFIINLFVVFKK